MKKLTALLLALLTVLTLSVPAGAAKASTTPKTYVAKVDFENSVGRVESNTFVYKTGEVICFDPMLYKMTDHDGHDAIAKTKSYVRGNLIYYAFEEHNDGEIFSRLCSSDIEVVRGKNKKVLYDPKKETKITVIGGYGASVIFKEGSAVKKYYNGKVTTLINSVNGEVEIFNGKLYYGKTTAYDLKTGKKSSFKAKAIYTTDKYLYYINQNSNLKRIGLDSKTQTVAKGVKNVLFTSSWSGGEAIYTLKNDNKNNISYYYKRGDKAAIKLFDEKTVLSKFKKKVVETQKVNSKDVKNSVFGSLSKEITRNETYPYVLEFMVEIPDHKGAELGYDFWFGINVTNKGFYARNCSGYDNF